MRCWAALGTAVACAGIAAGAVVAVSLAPDAEPSRLPGVAAPALSVPGRGAAAVPDRGAEDPPAADPRRSVLGETIARDIDEQVAADAEEERAVEADAGSEGSGGGAPAAVAAGPMPTAFPIADAAVGSVELFGPGGVPMGRALPNPTKYGLPLVFRVMSEQGDWLEVQVPLRPNGMRAFIRRSDVTLRTVPNWIKVELGTRKVTVFHGDEPVLQTMGTIGKESSPTPTGWYYVDASVRLTDPTGPYGTGQLALSGFSEVYESFGGGEGQIALHGTNAPGLLGQAASNGCVRLENGVFLQVQELAPTGTPVQIVP